MVTGKMLQLVGVLHVPAVFHSSLIVRDFYCFIPTSAHNTSNFFAASGSTTFDFLTGTVYAFLSQMNINSEPSLTFKLSTDPMKMPWKPLTSSDDWAFAISRVRNKKAQQRVNSHRSVDILIGLSDVVRPIVWSMVMLTLTFTKSLGDRLKLQPDTGTSKPKGRR